jgi:tetratricopeptide (TPR) repeat protein
MKRLSLILLCCFLFAGCAITKNPEPKQPDPSSVSVHYFLLAQTAFQERNLDLAIDLFQKAAKADPSSLYIKERLFEAMNFKMFREPEYASEITRIGENIYLEKVYSIPILNIIAEAWRRQGNFERTNFFLNLSMDLNPDMRQITNFYLFQKNLFPPADDSLPLKALEQPWKDSQNVLFLAKIIAEKDLEHSIEILEKAYEIWSEENIFKQLLAAYDQAGKRDSIIETIQERLDTNKEVSESHIRFLISNYLTDHKWESILHNSEKILELKNPTLHEYLFIASVFQNEIETGIQAGEMLLRSEETTSEQLAFIQIELAKFYLHQDDYAAAVSILSNLDEYSRREFIYLYTRDFGPEAVQKTEMLLVFLGALLGDENHTKYYKAVLYSFLKEENKVIDAISEIESEFLKQNELNILTAKLLLENSDDYEQAIELVKINPDSVFSANEIVSIILYTIGKDSLSFEVIIKELKENPQPQASTFQRYSILAEEFDTYNNLKETLLKAIKLYPEDADLKNALGYIIAKNAVFADFDLAYELLQKAVEIQPDNEMIWDSLAWLYFVDGKPEEALDAMKIPLLNEIKQSEIAYHLGAIYWQLGMIDSAKLYLEITINLNNDDQSVYEAQKLLEIIGD